MWLIDALAEARILQARERGEFDDLPGAGKPIVLDDDRMVPEALRPGYRLLKNAGCVPPEIESLRAVRTLAARVAKTADPAERAPAVRRLRLLETRLALEGRGLAAVRQGYRDRLLESLGRPDDRSEADDA